MFFLTISRILFDWCSFGLAEQWFVIMAFIILLVKLASIPVLISKSDDKWIGLLKYPCHEF